MQGRFLAVALLPLRSVSFVSFGVNPSRVFKVHIKCPLFYCKPIKALAREWWLAKQVQVAFHSPSLSAIPMDASIKTPACCCSQQRHARLHGNCRISQYDAEERKHLSFIFESQDCIDALMYEPFISSTYQIPKCLLIIYILKGQEENRNGYFSYE